jgi:hypothetical protein
MRLVMGPGLPRQLSPMNMIEGRTLYITPIARRLLTQTGKNKVPLLLISTDERCLEIRIVAMEEKLSNKNVACLSFEGPRLGIAHVQDSRALPWPLPPSALASLLASHSLTQWHSPEGLREKGRRTGANDLSSYSSPLSSFPLLEGCRKSRAETVGERIEKKIPSSLPSLSLSSLYENAHGILERLQCHFYT